MNPRWRMLRAAHALRAGGVVLYPTEGVWGLGCDPRQAAAIRRLLHLKHRPARKGLILIAARAAHFRPYSRTPLPSLRADRAVTCLVPTRRGVSPLLRGEHQTIALRVCAHPPTRALCQAFGRALVSTSANRSGTPPATRRWPALRQWGRRVDAIAPGHTGSQGGASRIFDTVTGQWIR